MKVKAEIFKSKFIRRYALLFIIGFLPGYAQGQFVIPQGTNISASTGTDITISASGDLINESNFNFSSAELLLTLVGEDQNIEGNFTAKSLTLSGTGPFLIEGTMAVTTDINFLQGIITVPSRSTLVFSGDGDTGIKEDEDLADSFVDGILFQTGGGNKRYPIGFNSTYAALEFADMKTSANDTVGARVNEGSSGITIGDIANGSVSEVFEDHHWEIVTTSGTSIESIKSLVSLSENEVFLSSGDKQVLQTTGEGATNLGFTFSPDQGFVLSQKNVTAPLLAIGRSNQITITVHQLITPFGSINKNDKLDIENIESFPKISVKLLDRYGVLIKEWGDNFPTEVEQYDFSRLSPGSYICIVEYGNTADDMRKETQMITVLRSAK
jgi:hypothetical protein